MSGFTLFIGFLSTLLATLIGVVVGFWNNRQMEKINRYDRSIQHLNSIQSELKRNKKTIDNNVDIVDYLQGSGGGDSLHYTLSSLARDGWETAINDGIIQDLDAETYRDLSEIYYRIIIVNQLVNRLQIESIHPLLGEVDDEGIFEDETWTVPVTYWDEEASEIKDGELASVIETKCNQVGIRIEDILEEFQTSISELQSKKSDAENRSLKRFF